MTSELEPERFSREPYRRLLAEGNGTLDLRYFATDALETYRNDPRYHFTYWDVGLSFGIDDPAYLDAEEPVKDKINFTDAGFAYIIPSNDTDPIVRRVCIFLGDLSKLTPEHQRRMESYEITGPELERLRPHPMWFGAQMGNWPDGLGPFEKILLEMKAINELTERGYGKPLFNSTERPREFGWVLRTSQAEWDSFVHQADKLLSDNLSHAALDEMGAPRENTDGTTMGSLNRLEWVLTNQTNVDADHIRERLQPLRKVRSARQKPAHALRQNVADRTLVRRQRDLLNDIATSLQSLRILFSRHPKNASWEPDDLLDGKSYLL